ncbi:MAG: hypothetical protein K5780_00630 [Alphaproteobacteria bacterium]|nr:hypothetical protein [Alphaproteobacteria bacterium]
MSEQLKQYDYKNEQLLYDKRRSNFRPVECEYHWKINLSSEMHGYGSI